jgi:hypothetical protein
VTARVIAQRILTAEGFARDGRAPRVPELDDLALLARDYLSRTEGGETLAQQGAVYVSHAAAVTYARAEDIGTEEARRELTEILLDARQVESDPTQWRYRRRSTDLDITCRVAREGRLLVATSVNVRTRNSGGRRG